MSPSTNPIHPPKRRWYQYSLRSLLIFMTVTGTGLGFLGIRVQQRHRQKLAAEAIVKSNGEVYYDYQCDAEGEENSNAASPQLSWLRSVFGNEFCDSIVTVGVGQDSQFEYLKDLPDLKFIRFHC